MPAHPTPDGVKEKTEDRSITWRLLAGQRSWELITGGCVRLGQRGSGSLRRHEQRSPAFGDEGEAVIIFVSFVLVPLFYVVLKYFEIASSRLITSPFRTLLMIRKAPSFAPGGSFSL